MQPGPRAPSFGELAGHAAIGAGLGVFLSLTLIIGDTAHISGMIVNSSNPEMTILMFIGIFSSVLAVGATLTGLIFSKFDAR